MKRLTKRPFNYVLLSPGVDSLQLVTRCLPGEGCPPSGVLDSVTLPYPNPEILETARQVR
jgi:hypothetical protein